MTNLKGSAESGRDHDRGEVPRGSVVVEGGLPSCTARLHLVWKRASRSRRFARSATTPRSAARSSSSVHPGGGASSPSSRSGRRRSCRRATSATITTPDGQWMPYMVLEWLEGLTLEAALLEEERGRGAPLRSAEQAMGAARSGRRGAGARAREGDRPPRREARETSSSSATRARAASGSSSSTSASRRWCRRRSARRARSTRRAATSRASRRSTARPSSSRAPTARPARGPTCSPFALIFSEIVSGKQALVGDTLPELAYASCDREAPSHAAPPRRQRLRSRRGR